MNPEPVDVKLIFAEALEKIDAREQAAYLDSVCGGDAALRAEVESLLISHDRAHGFLPSPDLDQPLMLDGTPLVEGPGTVIGRYKLLEKIGEGGMAVVYMAEQEEPIRRKVALKIIKLGMDTKSVIARFEAERQALAMMDHPNIAKVLDAGATETGRPYFVMELVKGVSITDYCDANSLSTKERLELFIQVCNAVQHAHQKGIIHRDIKPTNVMVTLHDGKPVPKVIDFGIAKAINQKLTEKTLFTRYAHIVGTPAYMSPEQAELSDLDIDTRTDIYSLGVLLYELLTGTTPFGEEELRKAGYIEMQRVIREQEPVKPSTKLSTLGDTLTDIAKHRSSTPELLRKAVRGDLDWIVMKSLEKDRARRYETANGLALDIRRHIEHEPVVARGPGATYRLQKFLRRHRSQTVAALAMVIFAGSVAVILSMWNRDRLQLNEAEGFRHRGILSQAREQYAKADREAALETIKPILDSRHVGPEARLLYAGILVDNRRSGEAVTVLGNLLNERPEIAGAAHSLLARILWESASPNATVGATPCGCPIHRPALSEAEGAATRGRPYDAIEDHRRQAEALLPETAEAYFLRAMTAITIKEQLAALNKALQIDPAHYESRRLRAYTYYASRKYDKMKDDALVMAVSRPRDPLGYSLRAVALRELGKYVEAIAEYDSALARTPKKDPQHIDLSAQHCETLLCMGDYERVITDAQECLKLSPDKPVFQYHTFSALTALGDYEKADAVFREIVSRAPTSRNELREWCAKYVFDTLGAGRAWHPPDREPPSTRSAPAGLRAQASRAPARDLGAAFLPMAETEETYRSLSAKARRLTTDGFGARWSPDGKNLAFSLGVQGRSGVAVFDPATKETELLIVPGKDPAWSPDGKHIAFVRDRQSLRLEELALAERGGQQRPVIDEEVWVMKSDGTEPKLLARGNGPSWSSDSQRIYYQSRGDGMLYSVSLVAQDAEPKRIMKFSTSLLSVSPDNRRVACFEGGSLKIMDLLSQTPTAEHAVPSVSWGVTAWSPTGEEVCLGGSNPAMQKTGLWIYDLAKKELLRVLDGQIASASWSPRATDLAFCLGPPYHEIWAANLDPNIPTIGALGPARTLREHYREMVALYTRRIKADPLDADAYLRRAQQYHFLREGVRVQADMRRYSAIVTQGSLPDLESGMAQDFERVINGPFNYQLVFSAERLVNETPVLNVALGQKGRCSMKSFQIPTLSIYGLATRGVAMSLLGLCFLSGLDTLPARADFTFGEPTNLGAVVNKGTAEVVSCISEDGLEMYFSSDRPGGSGEWDMWVTRRASKDAPWGTAENLGPAINTRLQEVGATISADGLSLYFSSQDRTGGFGSFDIWMTTRPSRNDPWGEPVNVGSKVNSGYADFTPWITADGLELYFSSWRAVGYGASDIYVARRATTKDHWGEPVNLGPIVNSPCEEMMPCVSPDGLLLFFSDWWEAGFRPGGYGGEDMWMTRRATTSDPWQAPVNLGPKVNGPQCDTPPRISPDGRTLYFSSARPGGFGGHHYGDIWQAPILPVCDFNADGQVDEKDILVMTEHWGQNYPPCDIGPMPWGDGAVDAQDLMVLMETIEGPGFVLNPPPHALEVLRDVILSWTSPKFAKTHDVYFGTSFKDVSIADRGNPRGVLASQDQTGTTYDPPGLLEFERTYYWRIDEVGPAPDFTIYRGPVLDFTTEAYAYPIAKIIATASSSQGDWGPENTINGSGLDKNDGHSTTASHMWLSALDGPQPVWIQYEFDRVHAVHEMWVWNHNLPSEPTIGFGFKNVSVQHSSNGLDWTALPDMEFAQATGQDGYADNTTVNFGDVAARYVRLTAKSNWSGGTAPCGLSEVRFFYIPLYASQPTPASGRKGVALDAIVTWKPGREAASHRVYFSTDQEAVTSGDALVDTITNHAFDPGPLDLGRTYYWRIDEVNEAATLSIRQGEVWSFSTKEYFVVDDFESYTDNDAAGQAIWQTWIDGLDVPDNGSQVGNLMPPYAERTIVHWGRQSMSMAYNNTQSSFYSQAERIFSPVQEWTVNGADTLTLWFRGNPIDFLQRTDGSIQMSGGGVDIWGNSDQFRFAYRQLSGDGSIVAKIHSLTNTDSWAKAGVMIRDSLEPTSMYAFTFPTPDGRCAFQNRKDSGGIATSAHSNVGAVSFPVWLKLERKGTAERAGSIFTGYYSQDGKNWTICQPDTSASPASDSTNPVRIKMGADVYIGLAVTSHNTSRPAIAEFSDVSFTGTVTGQWQVAAIGVEQPSNDAAPLYIAVEDSAGHVKSLTHPDPAAVQAADWQEWMIPLSEFQGVNLAGVEKMYIGVGDRNNPIAGGNGLIYIDDIGFGHPLSAE